MQNSLLRLRMICNAVLASENGQDLPEYALTVVMIALGSVAGMNSIAGGVNQVFLAVTDTLNNAV